jgi:hypothetical protein
MFCAGTFKLSLVFSEDYPNKAPAVKFITKMFHPNIYADGAICLDILQNQWSPIYDISAILTSIQSLLTDPNPNSPANSGEEDPHLSPPSGLHIQHNEARLSTSTYLDLVVLQIWDIDHCADFMLLQRPRSCT